MALSLAVIVILCLLVEYGLRRLGIPGLTGMLLAGVALGPHAAGVISPELASISGDLRMVALIVILLRAGLELSKKTLARVGLRALLFSFIPATIEGIAVTFLGHWLLELSYLEAAILGAILSAVSPAVVVPLMIRFMEQRKGTGKGIPTLVLAASSIDDVFVIVVYSSLIGLYVGGEVNLAWELAGIPLSIVLGVAVGLSTGYVLYRLFRRFSPRATKRLLVVVGVSILLVSIEHHLREIVPFAALLAVMAVGFIILEKNEYMAHEISRKLGKVWVLAEIVLFALVGAQVNVDVALQAGGAAAVLIALGLVARSAGSYLCLLGSNLTRGERLFVVVSYLPKATVQAAIGSAPLMAMTAAGMDTRPGEVILAVAALSILLTAPAGAWAIRLLGDKVLESEEAPRGAQVSADAVEADVLQSLTVGAVMDADAVAVRTSTSLGRVLEAFAEVSGTTVPVVGSANTLSGEVVLADLKPVLATQFMWPWLLAVDVMRPVSGVLAPSDSLEMARQRFDAGGSRVLCVAEPDTGRLVGTLERRALEHAIEERTAAWLAGLTRRGDVAGVG